MSLFTSCWSAVYHWSDPSIRVFANGRASKFTVMLSVKQGRREYQFSCHCSLTNLKTNPSLQLPKSRVARGKTLGRFPLPIFGVSSSFQRWITPCLLPLNFAGCPPLLQRQTFDNLFTRPLISVCKEKQVYLSKSIFC